MHQSLLKRFPFLFGSCLPVSSVSNFHPDRQAEVVSCSGSLVQSRCGEEGALRGGRGAAFPVYAAQAPSYSIWSVPCVACGSSFQVLHKSVDSVAPAFCAFPGRNSSGSRELDGHTLPGCGAPSALRGPSLSFCPWQSGV